MHADADYLASKGFSVIREKIEATAYEIEVITEADKDTNAFNTKSFEFHIKVGRPGEDQRPLDEVEVGLLKTVSRRFMADFPIPVPLSYNCNKDAVAGDRVGVPAIFECTI